MKFADKLADYPKKTITKDEIAGLIGDRTEEAVFAQVEPCVRDGLLKPVIRSGTNGNRRYPLYLKYRIVLPERDDSDMLAEIGALHILLQKNGVLSHNPGLYRSHRDALRLLSEYLFRRFRRDAGAVPISRKERSFEIFGEEKQLDDKDFRNLLKRLEITAETLGFYDTPEYCFCDYIPERTAGMTLLICENKDIWFNLRRMMFENNARTLWGTALDGVIYGEGEKICKAGSLTEYTRFLGDSRARYLYWGDIDREGLNIYLRLCRANPGTQIDLFVPAYRQMLRRAESVTIPKSADKREITEDYSAVYDAFPEGDRTRLSQAISSNQRIPQEIISYAVLLSEMR